MKIFLPADINGRIQSHCIRGYPEEGCGLLIGSTRHNNVTVVDVVETVNSAEGDRSRRFSIEPKTLIEAQREARNLGRDMVGVYHSHPDFAAEPSTVDLNDAWPQYVYLILSIRLGRFVGQGAWMLNEAQTGFVSVSIRA